MTLRKEPTKEQQRQIWMLYAIFTTLRYTNGKYIGWDEEWIICDRMCIQNTSHTRWLGKRAFQLRDARNVELLESLCRYIVMKYY